ncbi:MAG: FhaA domain-containing protein [Kineosporiaceae bacterium]
MGMLDKFEKGIEGAVNRAFAKAFKSEVQPVEVASALRKEIDDRAAVVGRDRVLVPNTFVVELGQEDFARLGEWHDALCDELVADIREHAVAQRYTFLGPVTVRFDHAPDLETGVFRVVSGTTRGVPDVASASSTESPPRAAGPGGRPGEGSPAGHVPAADPYPHVPPAPQGYAPSAYAQDPYAQDAYAQSEYAAEEYAPDPYGHDPLDTPRSAAARAAAAADDPFAFFGPAGAQGHAGPPAVAAPPGHQIPGAVGKPVPGAAVPAAADPQHWQAPSPAEGGYAVLEVDGQAIPLTRPVTVLGRSSEADLTLEDPGISRRHAEIHVLDGNPRIVDLGSTNGTYVDGSRIHTTALTDGSVITVGRTRLVLRLGRR